MTKPTQALAALLSFGPAALLLAAAGPPPGADKPLRPLYEALSPERARVGVIGPAPIAAEEARSLILRAAARLTLRRGFDWFEPIGEPATPPESKLARDPRPRPGHPAPDLRLLWSEQCADGWKSGPEPQSLCGAAGAPAPGALEQATTQVMMGHGRPPQNDMAVAARAWLNP